MRKGALTASLAVAVCLVVAAAGVAKLTDFGKRKTTAIGANPTALVVADFNRDGRPDAVSTAFEQSTLSVLKGRGGRGMKRVKTIPVPLQPDKMLAARVNGDKNLDLVIGSLDDSIMIFYGRKGFGFMPPVQVPSMGWPRSLAAADFNGDGRLDIATGRQQANDTVVHLQNPDGSFATSGPLMDQAFSLAAADLDEDGSEDLVGYSVTLDRLVIHPGNGDGTFAGTSIISLGEGGIEKIVPIDLDRDGNLDLALLRDGFEPPGRNDIIVLIGKGDGSFQQPKTYPVGAQAVSNVGDRPGDVVFARLNGDKHMDAAVTIELSHAGHSNKVAILKGKKGGKFGSPKFIAGGPDPERIGAYRANKDKFRDLLIAGTRPAKNGDPFDPGTGVASVRIKK